MKPTKQDFYKKFYGPKFVRHFRAPTDVKNKNLKYSGNQVLIQNYRTLWSLVYKRSGLLPCYTHVYDHENLNNLKQKSVNMTYDRAFFDFDIDHEHSHQIKKKLQNLRSHNLKHDPIQQDKLREQLRKFIIEEQIAVPAINEAKDFSIKFKDSFGSYPLLFFSGCKGCHAYTFFNSIKNININQSLSWFGKQIKETYQYQTLDLSVLQDAQSRLSRVPYSKHQYTLLTVVPFTINDKYDTIINKSINPTVKSFKRENYLSTLGEHLKKIDPILKEKAEEKQKREINHKSLYNNINQFKSFSGIKNHITYFKNLLGPPKNEYPDKEYVMFCCPFPDHDDNNPSFKVHKTNYECYGCGKKGNLAKKEDYLKFKKMMGWTNI